MNWVAFNDAPRRRAAGGEVNRTLPYFMYPQAEVGGVRRDSLDAETFRLSDHRAKRSSDD